MRHRGVRLVLLAGLLMGLLLPAVAPASYARAVPDSAEDSAAGSAVAARLAPPVVRVGEPTGLATLATPVRAGRTITLQTGDGSTWTTVTTATTSSAGRVFFPLSSATLGSQTLRVVAAAYGSLPRRTSPAVTLRVTPEAPCTPKTPVVDPEATPAATCLAARLDRWRSSGLMGVGQQLNVSNKEYLAPLTALAPRRVSVVGFDLEELALGETYQFPDPPLDTLARLAREGAVLSATWHTTNPHTQGTAWDRSWTSLDALLSTTTPEGERFWADFDGVLALFQRFQDAGVAVTFRPFHEANGNWFWWSHPNPATYRKLWAMMQARARDAGIHNLLWAYGFNAKTGSHIVKPETLVPARVDLAGIDSYDPEGEGHRGDELSMAGYAAVAAKVRRMAITEVGPYDSPDGRWNPAIVTRTARAQKSSPVWAMLWFDDGLGQKQIASLRGGPAWLDSCAGGYCYLG